MANLLEGLFGLRPNLESQQEQMQTERGMGFGELLGRAGVNPYAPKAVQDAYLGRQAAQGALVGRLGNTVAGLFGMETPELQRAKGMESILQQTQADTDLNNPAEFYPLLAKRMAEAGFTQEAIQIGQVGAKAIQDFNLSSSTISKNNAQALAAGRGSNSSIEQQIVLYSNKAANEGLTEKEAQQYNALVEMKNTNSGKRFSTIPKGGAVFDAVTGTYSMPPTVAGESTVELEKGEVWNPATEKVESVKGSKIYVAQKKAFTDTYKDAKATISNATDALTKLANLNEDQTGFEYNFGGVNAAISKYIPGKGLPYLTKLDGFKSNMRQIGLSFMRQGGSIGQITEREWPMIEKALATLSSNLNEDDAKFQMDLIKTRFENVIRDTQSAYKTEFADTQFYKPLDEYESPIDDDKVVVLQPSTMSDKDWAEYQAYLKSQGGS